MRRGAEIPWAPPAEMTSTLFGEFSEEIAGESHSVAARKYEVTSNLEELIAVLVETAGAMFAQVGVEHPQELTRFFDWSSGAARTGSFPWFTTCM